MNNNHSDVFKASNGFLDYFKGRDDIDIFSYTARTYRRSVEDILRRSRTLVDEINVRSIMDPDGLRSDFIKGWLRMRIINENEFFIYENPNPRGNSLCSVGLNKKGGEVLVSNSDNARFSSRNRVIEIIKSNPDFCYFFTGTFNPKKWNRKDFKELHKCLTRWLRRRGIKYILIPEPHNDGSIHFHGFFSASIEPFLSEFDLSKKLPKRITDGIKEGRLIFNCPDYAKMFGWVSIEKVRSLEACAVYVSKYVSKSFNNDDARFAYHRYFCSLGLNRPYSGIPNQDNLIGFEPVRFSSKIVKAVYKKQTPSVPKISLPLGGPFEPSWSRSALGLPKNPVFSGGARSAHLNEGGTVERVC